MNNKMSKHGQDIFRIIMSHNKSKLKTKGVRLLNDAIKAMRMASDKLDKLSVFLIISQRQADVKRLKKEIASNKMIEDGNQHNHPPEEGRSNSVTTRNSNDDDGVIFYLKCYRNMLPEEEIVKVLRSLNLTNFEINLTHRLHNWSMCSIHIKDPDVYFPTVRKALKVAIKGCSLMDSV
ncbi:uncharacterized protein LOC106664286 [Cimex lectularius]|uniref:Uncharacterized protein n=1 Tax=Cimex lectularius TaxID=79782 RepID=A0A8I6RNE9_CIMLE|nr:uncharacterized protein LOC106664286 [Cimex lectularius]